MPHDFLSNEQKGVLCVIASGLLYGLLGYFGMTIIAEGFSRYNMLFWRFSVASIFMLFIISPKIKTLSESPREVLKMFFFGAIFHGVAVILYFTSAIYVGTGIAMVLFFLYPVIVILLNRVFYHTKISKTYYYSISLILLGLVLLIDITNLNLNIFGIVIGILDAVFYALYVVASKNSKLSSVLATFAMVLGCVLTTFIFSVFDSSFQVPTTFALWLNVVTMGVLCTALPILFFLKGLQYIDSAKVSILGVTEPLAVMFFSYILLGERMTLLQFCGAMSILFGAVMVLNPLKALNSFRNRNRKFRG